MKRTTGLTAKIPERPAGIVSGGDNIEFSVTIEIVDDRTTAQVLRINAEFRSDIFEPLDIELGAKRGGGNPVRLGDRLGVIADGHADQIQEPRGLQVIGL